MSNSAIGSVIKWTQPNNVKGGPPTLKNHTVTAYKTHLFCFGGYDGHVNHKSLLVYNIDKQEWVEVKTEHEIEEQFATDHHHHHHRRRRHQRIDSSSSRSTNYQTSRRRNDSSNGSVDGATGMYFHHGNNRMNNAPIEAQHALRIPNELDNSSSNDIYTLIGNPPKGRNGHTATRAKRIVDGNGNDNEERMCIFIIGGWLGQGPYAADDLHILDITNPHELIWMPVRQSQENTPGPCNMHSADFVPKRNEIFVFRGGDGNEYLNELHALNVDNLLWRNVQTTGEAPQKRANHSSAFLEETDQLFIFGGWNGKERLNDIHILDTTTSTWTHPEVHGSLPHPRAGMSLSALRGKLYLFGGSGTSSKCFNDLHVFSPSEMTWLEVVQEEERSRAIRQASNEISPQALGDGGDVGGLSDSNAQLIEDWRSQEAFTSTKASAANPNEIEYEPCISIKGSGPGLRAGHTATAINRFIYVFGGGCGRDYLNDFFVLDTDPVQKPEVSNPTSQQLVGKRLKYLCNSEEFADVVFLVEGRRIYAHKMILSLASDFYAAMFSTSNGFKEMSSFCPEIEVPNCSYDAFLAIMAYIYSGNDPSLHSFAIEEVVDILHMADQLLLDHLKQRCEQILQPRVDENTVEFLHQICQKTNAIQLMECCDHFLRNHT